jgi:hypothetical protein
MNGAMIVDGAGGAELLAGRIGAVECTGISQSVTFRIGNELMWNVGIDRHPFDGLAFLDLGVRIGKHELAVSVLDDGDGLHVVGHRDGKV